MSREVVEGFAAPSAEPVFPEISIFNLKILDSPTHVFKLILLLLPRTFRIHFVLEAAVGSFVETLQLP